nr:DUF305 domain-containing protein [Micromonospora sp. DSM 115978]
MTATVRRVLAGGTLLAALLAGGLAAGQRTAPPARPIPAASAAEASPPGVGRAAGPTGDDAVGGDALGSDAVGGDAVGGDAAGGDAAGGDAAGGDAAGGDAAGGPSATEVAEGRFSATDVAWLQLAFALDERALGVLGVASDRGDPAVRRLAERIADGHRAEAGRFRALLDLAGAPATNPHDGHDMPGMATAVDLAAIRRATGPALTKLVRDSLRAHLEQSVHLARAEQSGGTEPRTQALAAAVERDRVRALDQLAALPG